MDSKSSNATKPLTIIYGKGFCVFVPVNNQTIKQSNNQTIKQSNNQTIKQSNIFACTCT
jgi:hypothetical protein